MRSRGLPVPRTGRRFRMKKFLRYPKTTAEKRWNIGHEKEGIRTRKKRRYTPTAWDDLWRYPERTWKKHRRNQWKEV